MNAILTVANYITKSFPFLTIILAAVAFFFPQLFLFYGKSLIILLGLIMLGMGLTMTPNDFKLVLSRPKDVFIGVAGRYFLMPLIAWGLVKVFHLDPMLAVGVILIGCCPSGTSSNVMAFLGKGDAALSVTLSSINTLLAPILTPFIFLYLADSIIPVNAMALLLDILKIVILPIFTGLILRRLFPRVVNSTIKFLPATSVVLILTILAYVVAANAQRLSAVALIVFVIVIVQNVLGYISGYGLGKLVGMDHKRAKTISFEVGIENTALAVALAVAHLNPVAAIPAAVFSFVETLSGSLLASYWAYKDSKQQDTPDLSIQSE